MSAKNFTLSVLLIHEGCGEDEGWVAQCLEYDIAAQGKSIAEAKKAFVRTVVGQVVVDVSHGEEPFQGIKRAPKDYWDKFESAERLTDRQPIRFPDVVPSQVTAHTEDMRVFA